MTRAMKLYFAGPLFTTAERVWNAEVTAALRAAGREVLLPQEREPGEDARGIFAKVSRSSFRADPGRCGACPRGLRDGRRQSYLGDDQRFLRRASDPDIGDA
jgi:hypothetical protein